MTDIWTVIPSRTDEYLDPLLRSLEISEPGSSAYCAVADNGLSSAITTRWPFTVVHLALPFCFAAAINRAVARIPGKADILILNDDTTMKTDFWRMRAKVLFCHAASDEYGMISLAIDGGVGNSEQVYRQTEDRFIVEAKKTLCFVAVLIRRKAWDAVGPLDERFVAYGYDDDDYCHRMRLAGWRCGVTQQLVVTHGAGGYPHSSSYKRYHEQDEHDRLFHDNQRIYIDKWGGPPGYERHGYRG